ncbi:MAG TPA: two-component sensor histidine kinase, partial [Nitrospirae bacterium]|nr:two-component sensor histidine kinase [Nitrospirota bacterium]
AMDAIPDEGREGRITIAARGEADSEVEIKITDTGTGIPEKIIDRIFDPFFTTKDVGKGTGLGLFVTHNIIEQHGGSISVGSRVGEGTVFTIKLPAQGGERNG